MRFLESIAGVSYRLFSAVMILTGFMTIILAVINSPWQLQIALGLIGLGFIALGLVYVKRAQNENIEEQRFNRIMARLDEIQGEIKNAEQSKGTGVAIADVLSSGLKYYSEYITKQKKEEDNE